ncbi:N-formylglutamate amidohydrolase [Neorhodopirellula lusitana]|uniref:N-formylglutamate amidohydrolase n=1 Tax=Neorhodopirellula lusitana TaxID=445327 RepID=A0ABY1QMV7_9BACT|nr:N-formylglutamate amidohydrolase [Neorhodopirellula lusitana]SMP75301.1 N-formylglutamate amidohydrolase [Neorhodopirellula lusitana]
MSLLVTCDGGGWKTPVRLKGRLNDRLPEVGVLRLPEPGLDSAVSIPIGASSIQNVADDPALHVALPQCGGRRCDRAANLAARKIALHSGADLIVNEYRADLVNVGRSLHHRSLFPAPVRELPEATRKAIVEEIYTPYRNRVRQRIERLLCSWSYVVHLSIRTFEAKSANGQWRRGDLGLQYDSSRPDEVDWCLDAIDELYDAVPNLKVRRNHPHRGTNDSLTKSMRSEFSPEVYLGIEIDLNRAWAARPVGRRDLVLDLIGQAIGGLKAEPIRMAA